jgi:hypothetical protein
MSENAIELFFLQIATGMFQLMQIESEIFGIEEITQLKEIVYNLAAALRAAARCVLT